MLQNANMKSYVVDQMVTLPINLSDDLSHLRYFESLNNQNLEKYSIYTVSQWSDAKIQNPFVL